MSKEKNLPLMNLFEISPPRRLSKGFVTCCGEGTPSSNTFFRDNHSSLLAELSRKERKERETSAALRCVFYHACTGLSLPTSNVLVTCDTTYRTGLVCAITTVGSEISRMRSQMGTHIPH